jgi:lanosterol synthase
MVMPFAKNASTMYSPLHVPETGVKPFTDYSRWRLLVNDGGRHVWKYLKTDCEMGEWPQNTVDKYWMGLPVVHFPLSTSLCISSLRQNLPTLPTPKTPLEAAKNGYTFYKELQCHDGHWAGEYGGPMFLLPGMVIGSYVAGMGFTDEQRLEMVRYLFNHVNSDGGWGM